MGKVLRFRPRRSPEPPPDPAIGREQFLAAPWDALRAGDTRLPAEWIGDAWSQRPFRRRVTEALTRSVRDDGDFFAVQGLLDVISRAGLRREAVVELYVAIRDGSTRREEEWRRDFEAAFVDHASCLPPEVGAPR